MLGFVIVCMFACLFIFRYFSQLDEVYSELSSGSFDSIYMCTLVDPKGAGGRKYLVIMST